MTEEQRKIIIEKCSEEGSRAIMPNLPYSEFDEEESSSSSGSESDTSRLWDLAHIFSVRELNKPEPKMCSWGDDCGLVACSKWVTEGRAPWYSCLDCQVE